MRKWLALPVLLVAALLFAASGIASDHDGKHGDKKSEKQHGKGHSGKSQKFGPFLIHTTDNGSCAPPPGHEWADLTLQRTYKVKQNSDGTFRVRREDRGMFVTRAARSPGACETGSRHGQTIRAGVTGKIHGFLQGTVTGGTYNPNATCPTECTTGAFITAFFGPNAQFTCFNGYAGCRFAFEYTAPKQGLLFHHWSDKGLDGQTEVFRGDIASG
jgi:hypothetical protein